MKADSHEKKNKTYAGRGRLAGSKAGVFILGILGAGLIAAGAWLFWPQAGSAHCDTMDGPVVKEAKVALEKKDVTSVLKWVKKEYEAEIKDAFKKTLAVRAKGKEAKALADTYFFETLVRLHRAGEGAPYTGLKAEGEHEPAVEAADKALETGSSEELVRRARGALIGRRGLQGGPARFYLACAVENGLLFANFALQNLQIKVRRKS